MTTHTPGPWTIEPRPDDIFAIRGDGQHYYVARCSRGGLQEKHKRSLTEAQANARLIAAAPDLLAALKSITQIGLYNPSDGLSVAVKIAGDAIAKAEGTS